MSKNTEIGPEPTTVGREPIAVDDVEYTVTENVWGDGGSTFDVRKGDELLTDESLYHYPTIEDIRGLVLDENDPGSFPRTDCGCGYEIVRTPDGWQHDAAPWFWGDDHEPDVS